MDIKEQISKVVRKITEDKSMMELFKKDPIKAVEKVLGVDIPDDVEKKIVEGVKAKISVEKATAAFDALKKMI